MKLKILAIVSGLLITGLANAECPSSLNKMEMKQCQEIEKSGISYQDHLKQMEMKQSHMESTKSPVTGKDVTKMAPAAGAKKAAEDK